MVAVIGSIVFFALGLITVEVVEELTWQLVLYAVLSLTLVRMWPLPSP